MLLFVDEHLQVAGMGEVDLRGEQRRRQDAVLVLRGQIGQRDRQQRAADAVADACGPCFSPVACSIDVERGRAGRPSCSPRSFCARASASGLTQEITKTVRPWSTHHLMKDLSGVRSRM